VGDNEVDLGAIEALLHRPYVLALDVEGAHRDRLAKRICRSQAFQLIDYFALEAGAAA
jgi:hypothetical protein